KNRHQCLYQERVTVVKSRPCLSRTLIQTSDLDPILSILLTEQHIQALDIAAPFPLLQLRDLLLSGLQSRGDLFAGWMTPDPFSHQTTSLAHPGESRIHLDGKPNEPITIA